MKSLKLDHNLAIDVLNGTKTSTWRINDDKDLHVNDNVTLIDKVDPLKPETWMAIGVAKITSVLEKQLGQISQSDMAQNEKLAPLKDLLKMFRSYYGNQISNETPVKIIRFTFQKGDTGMTSRPPSIKLEVKLFADGGSRGNPGPSASGFVLLDMQDKIIAENGLFLGVTTNNQAEYQALKIGLEAALKHKASIVHVYMDSMLVVNQMKGAYKVSNKDLIAINHSLKDLVSQFEKVIFEHVPREHNKRADAIVNEVLDTSK